MVDLEDNLFDNNSEYEDCECNSDHVNHRGESVFDKSSYEEMLDMLCEKYPVKKNLQGKGGRKVNKNNKLLCLMFLK